MVRGSLIYPLMYSRPDSIGNELTNRGSWQWVASRDFHRSKNPSSNIRSVLQCTALMFLALSFSLPPLVTKKHEFFDSGLLYQFYINFRRRRRLSELLNEGEQDDNERVAMSTPEDNHPESPFTLQKSQPRKGNSAFQSGDKKSLRLFLQHTCSVVSVGYHMILLLTHSGNK